MSSFSAYSDQQRREFDAYSPGLQRNVSEGEQEALRQVAELQAREAEEAARARYLPSAARSSDSADWRRATQREADAIGARVGRDFAAMPARLQRDTRTAAQIGRDREIEQNAAAAHQMQADQEYAQEQEEASATLARQLAAEEEQPNMEFEIEEIPNDDWITQLFTSFDEDENGTIDWRELLGLFINFPYDPVTGQQISADEVDNMRQAMQDAGRPFESVAFASLFFRFDTDRNGTLDPHEFRRMIENGFEQSVRERIRTFMTAPLQAPPAAAPVVQGAIRPLTASAEIHNGITFRNLLDNFKIWDLDTQAREISRRVGHTRMAFLRGEGMRCFEIHKTIYLMLDLQEGLTNLETIIGKSYVHGNPDADAEIILNDFNQLLLLGVQLHDTNPIPGTARWSLDGLHMLINHLMTGNGEGLRGALVTAQMVGGPDLGIPLIRVMYLITHFFDGIQGFGRAGEFLIMSYVMTYLGLAVSGYGHTITSYIAADGGPFIDPEHGSAYSIITGCQAGNADRVLISFRGGLKTGLNKIADATGAHVEDEAATAGPTVGGPAAGPSPAALPDTDFPEYVEGDVTDADVTDRFRTKFNDLFVQYRTGDHSKNLEGFKKMLITEFKATDPDMTPIEERRRYLLKIAYLLYAPQPPFNDVFADDNDLNNPDAAVWKGGRLKRRARYTSKRGRRIKKNTTKKAHQVRKNKYIKKKKPKPVNKKTRVKKRGVTSKKSVKSLTSSTKRVRKSRKSRTRKV